MTLKVDGTNGVLQAYDYQVLTTGFSYTFAAGTQVLVANPAGTLATGTITMPASPVDGMTVTFISTKQITALTVAANTGQSIVSNPAALNANQAVSFIYRLSNTTWYPYTTQAAQPIGPAFSAYPSSGQSVSNATYTKVLFQTEEWDTNNNFASSAFTPTVAGYYNFNSNVERTSAAFTGESVLVFYKNGSPARYVYDLSVTSYCLSGSTNLYMNGTTDYVEVYMYQSTGGAITLTALATATNFSGFLARAA